MRQLLVCALLFLVPMTATAALPSDSCIQYQRMFEDGTPEPEALATFVRNHPDQYLPYLSLAGILMDQDPDHHADPRQLDDWFRDTPHQADFVRGLMARIQGDNKQARAHFRRMNRIPDSPLIVGQLLRMLPGEAESILSKVEPAGSFSPEMHTLLKQVYADRKSPVTCQTAITTLFQPLPTFARPDYVAFILYNYLYLQSLKRASPDTIMQTWQESPGPLLAETCIAYRVIFNQVLFRVATNNLSYERARSHVVEGLSASERFHFVRTRRLYRRWLAELEARDGRIPEAVRILKDELANASRFGDDLDRMNLLQTIGQIYLDNGMSELALPFLNEALPMFAERNRRQYPYLLALASQAVQEAGDLDRAARLAQEGIATAEQENLPSYVVLNARRLARVRIARGDVTGGIQIAEHYLNTPNVSPSERVALLFLLVTGYETAGNRCKALELAQQAASFDLPPMYTMTAELRLYQLLEGNPCHRFPLGPFDIFRRIRHILRAYQLSREIRVEAFSSLRERYEFLLSSRTIDRSYAVAWRDMARAVALLAALAIGLSGILWLSYMIWVRRRQHLIGPYRLKEKVGEGGMGDVYRAISLEDHREVALKILKTPVTGSPARVKQFKDEILILKRLDHPNILRYYDSGEHKGRLFLATEFLNGKTLQQKLEEEWPLSMELSLYIVGEVLNGLAYLHERGVLHRDIKPGNIMIADLKFTLTHPTGRMGRIVKLMDFGIAKQLGTESQTQGIEVAGTPAYIAPETLTMNKTGPASDIYAFGVTLYRLFAGVLPYEHPDPMVVQHQIMNPAFTPQAPSFMRRDLPPCVEQLILGCMEKSPKQRYQTVRDVQAAYLACMESVAQNNRPL